MIGAIDEQAKAIFKKALASTLSRENNLQVYLGYADRLRFRGKRQECLDVVAEALKSPSAARKNAGPMLMALHAVAVETALADSKDPERAEKAASHIKELIGCTYPRYQGLGHLFQGAIDLEQAGATAEKSALALDGPAPAPALQQQHQQQQHQQAKLRQCPESPEDRRGSVARHRRGAGAVRRRPGPRQGAGPGAAVPSKGGPPGKPRSSVPDLGGVVDGAGRLSGRG